MEPRAAAECFHSCFELLQTFMSVTITTETRKESQFSMFRLSYGTVEPRYNEPVYNEVSGIANDILQPRRPKLQ